MTEQMTEQLTEQLTDSQVRPTDTQVWRTDAIAVCPLDELPIDEAATAQVPGHGQVAVFHTEEGLFALRDRCSHQEARLSDGFAEGCWVECPLHESRFDLRTGWPDQAPATKPVQTFDSWCVDGFVYVAAAAQTQAQAHSQAQSRQGGAG